MSKIGEALELVSSSKSFGGFQKVFQHFSKELQCSMKFSLYEPELVSGNKINVLFYLSGLTCTHENFIMKSGFQKYASEHGLMVVGPDTSPRDVNIPGDKDNWDLGEGAGAYVDATEEPWSKHYRMYSYVTKELPELIKDNFNTSGIFGIFGHSMGGHGAIVCGLRNPNLFQSISAFAPITNPSVTEWAKTKSFISYLGKNEETWKAYDSTAIAESYDGPIRDVLIDQGTEDEFLEKILLVQNLKAAADRNTHKKVNINLKMRQGYNHSYYFVSTFMKDHFEHHSKILNSLSSK